MSMSREMKDTLKSNVMDSLGSNSFVPLHTGIVVETSLEKLNSLELKCLFDLIDNAIKANEV